MVSISENVALDGAEERSRAFSWRGPRFIAEVFDGADDALDALESVQRGLKCTGFQSLNWLTVLYEELAPSKKAMPRVVVVTERNTGEVAIVLPLVVTKKRTLRVARFADLGVSDYNAPMLGPVPMSKRRSQRRIWRAIRQALNDIDLIKLERMPAAIGDVPNPLALRAAATPARHHGNVLSVESTVEDFLRARGKKYRKEVERCYRVWEKEGTPRFRRVTRTEDVAHGYSTLEEQQAARHDSLGSNYVLDQPAYRSFYERLAIDGTECDLGYLFTLEAGGETVATLFGIVHEGTFTLLRISNGGAKWSHFSPGRLIVVETMKFFVSRGVRRFDMGIGDYPFKRGFGVTETPLFDLIVARDLAAMPRAAFHRLKARARQNPRILKLARWAMGKKD